MRLPALPTRSIGRPARTPGVIRPVANSCWACSPTTPRTAPRPTAIENHQPTLTEPGLAATSGWAGLPRTWPRSWRLNETGVSSGRRHRRHIFGLGELPTPLNALTGSAGPLGMGRRRRSTGGRRGQRRGVLMLARMLTSWTGWPAPSTGMRTACCRPRTPTSQSCRTTCASTGICCERSPPRRTLLEADTGPEASRRRRGAGRHRRHRPSRARASWSPPPRRPRCSRRQPPWLPPTVRPSCASDLRRPGLTSRSASVVCERCRLVCGSSPY